MDNLRFIRETMERAGSFTAVPGTGGILMGLSALAAAVIAAQQASLDRWLAAWVGEALIAVAIGAIAAAHKAKLVKTPLLTGPGRKFALGLLPSILVAALLTLVLYRAGLYALIPGIWLLLYGTGILSADRSGDGHLFCRVGSSGVVLPARVVTLAVGRRIRRIALTIRRTDCRAVWRLKEWRSKAHYGRNGARLRSRLPTRPRPNSTGWFTNGCAWES